MAKILVIDDEAPLRESLAYAFTKEGHEVLTAPDAGSGLELARRSAMDAIVLDLILPDRDGIDVCRQIRDWSRVPIVVLSARDQVPDRLLGFDVGADDYVTKPFNTKELVARVRAVLQRERSARVLLAQDGALLERLSEIVGEDEAAPRAAGPSDVPLSFAGFTLDPPASTVTFGGRTATLAPAEYRLIEVLMAEEGRVVTRTELCRRIWGLANHRTFILLEATVRTLTAKLEVDAGQPVHLVTLPGIGHRLL